MFARIFCAVLFMSMTGLALAANPAPAAPTIADFFHRPLYDQVKISPDGKYLALVAPLQEDQTQTVLDIVDLSDMSAVGSYKLRDRLQVSNIWWVDNDMLVFTAVIYAGGFDRPWRTGVVWTTDISGTAVKTLVRGGSVVSASYEHPGHVMVEGYAPTLTALTMDVYGEHTQRPLRKFTSSLEGWGHMMADNDETVRLAYGVNIKTAEPKLLYHSADPTSLDWKDISSLEKDEPSYSEFGPVTFTADNSQFYYEGATPAGTLGVYQVDTKDFSKKLLYSDPDYDVNYSFADRSDPAESFMPADNWLMSADLRTPLAFHYNAELPQWIVIKQDAPEVQALADLQDAFQGQAVLITSLTADNSKAVAFVYGDRNPGSYYLYDIKAKKVQLLFNVRPEIHPDDMAEMKPVSFKARDGKVVHGYLTLPKGHEKNVPLIVHPHGGPFGVRDEWGYDPEVQFLAYHGYAVLQVNYRGSGGYGTAFQEAGYKQWGGAMQDDLTDGTRWAIAQGIADPKRICISGASYGGYASLEGVVKEPDLYKCAVGYAGVYDLGLQRSKAHTLNGQFYIPFYSRTLGDDEADLKAHSPALHVDQIKADLFLAHGGGDKTVYEDQASTLRSALDKIKKPYVWVYYPNEGHGFYALDHQVDLYTKMLAFFEKEIGPGTRAP